MRPPTIRFGALTLTTAVTLLAPAVHAGPTPEQKCQKGRYAAAAKYAACEAKLMANYFGSGAIPDTKLSKCRTKYASTWTKLQAKASGTSSTCDNPRYQDHANGTVTDRLTGLQWEQKTDDTSDHDKDNTYTWTAGTTAADGTAYTTFLTTLNSGGCFAGHCDWRLPTRAELQTVLNAPYPCMSICVDPVVFGPTVSHYWTSTTHVEIPTFAWLVTPGTIGGGGKSDPFAVRAVRGGL